MLATETVELSSPLINKQTIDLSSIKDLEGFKDPHVILHTRSEYLSIRDPFSGLGYFYSVCDEGIIEPTPGYWNWIKNDAELDISTWKLVEEVESPLIFHTLAIMFGNDWPDQIANLEIITDTSFPYSDELELFITLDEATKPEVLEDIKNGSYQINEDNFHPEAEILRVFDGEEYSLLENVEDIEHLSEDEPIFDIYDWMEGIDNFSELMEDAESVVDATEYFSHNLLYEERLVALQKFFIDHPEYIQFPFVGFLLSGTYNSYQQALVLLRVYALVEYGTILIVTNDHE